MNPKQTMADVACFVRPRLMPCFSIILAAICVGCVPLKYKGSPYEGSYAGLRARWNETTNSATLRIIMVHGMGGLGNTVPGYGDSFAKMVAKQFQLSDECCNITNPLPSSTGITNFLRTFFFTNRLNNQLKFYEVTWSPMTTFIKSNEFAKDAEMNASGNRLPFNENLKQVVDSGFGDATLYLNPGYRQKMQEPILQTIVEVDRDATNEDDEIIFVTHSLGSKMAFDAMIENSSDQAVSNVLAKTTDIIMLANQLPLLDLGIETNELAVVSGKSGLSTSSTLFRFLDVVGKHKRYRHHKAEISPDFRVIAATDSNDALSFPLESGSALIGNVQVSFSDIYKYNDCGIFDLFFTWPPFLENPVNAHIGYLDNKSLIKRLVEGFP